ncbi:hypothetical protein CHCC20335_3340 [Bacillus paralicheniformis]|nr:hypothetical protein CHCC20335_3340 [Bacillus paralicheniformis]
MRNTFFSITTLLPFSVFSLPVPARRLLFVFYFAVCHA